MSVFCVPRAIITARNSAAVSYSADTCTDRGGSRGGTAGMCPPPPPFNNPTIYSHDVARYSIIGVFSCVFKRTLIAERSDRPCTAFVAHMVIHT